MRWAAIGLASWKLTELSALLTAMAQCRHEPRELLGALRPLLGQPGSRPAQRAQHALSVAVASC